MSPSSAVIAAAPPDVLFVRMRAAAAEFSPSQQKVANFVAQRADDVAFLTAAGLAREAGVSESVVVRFAQLLDFEGYPEFQAAVRRIVRQRLGTVEMLQRSAKAGTSGPALLMTVARLDAELALQSATVNDWSTVTRSIAAIRAAKRTYVFGQRTSFPLAHYLALSLNQVLGNVQILSLGAGELFDQLAHVREGDVLIGISFPRYVRSTIQALRAARARGATTIAITDSHASPASTAADITLVAASGTMSFVRSQAGALTVINILLAALSATAKDASLKALRSIDELLYSHGQLEVEEAE